MEAFAFYLIKSSVWLSGFALVYALFLRNERFFSLNRFFLVSGMLVSVVFPFFTWHYTILMPVVPSVEISEPQMQGIVVAEESFSTQYLLMFLYLSGVVFVAFRIFRQTLPVVRIIRKSEASQVNSIKLIRTTEYSASFSFISFVFVNPSTDEIETREIVNHEQEHIRQKHWIDLLFFEILRAMQWFNPVIWLYGRLIRQNHEYLADEFALQRSSNPAVYRAALLNQMFGGPVISLANSFNYSLNKKRFNMMKHTIKSPFRKLKLLIVLPLIAVVFYAFAAPEYQFVQTENSMNIQEGKIMTGKVTDTDGDPLPGASVIISGKTIGTVTDMSGKFELKLADDSPIVISFVGYESQKVNPEFGKELIIQMNTKVIGLEAMGNEISASKPIKSGDNQLILIDGKETTKSEMKSINPEKIEKRIVWKDQEAINKFGDKGKNGVIELILKSGSGTENQKVKVQTNSPLKFRSADGSETKPLIVKNGKISDDQNVDHIAPEAIESINILKDKSATDKYGEKGKNGVIEITMEPGKDVFVIVEEMPQFPGGADALKEYVASTMQYPVVALEKGIQGKVIVNFVVAQDGSVKDAKISRGVDPSLDKEALRIVNNMPKWTPGSQAGKPVKVSYTIPIIFKLPPKK
ncbi:MAG: TonB family protein [Prolixibacteraceae bacterium]